MTKKKQKKTPRPTSKKTRKPTPAELAEVDRIFTIWRDAANVGLGGKTFAKAVMDRYEPRLRARILLRLQSPKNHIFDANVEARTKTVAQDTGLVCALMSRDSVVTKDTFQSVFKLLKKHPACPRIGGAGTWCDIQL